MKRSSRLARRAVLAAALLAGCTDTSTRESRADPRDAAHTWHHADVVLFGITKYGVTPNYAPPGYQSDMPAFGGKLSDEEMMVPDNGTTAGLCQILGPTGWIQVLFRSRSV